MKYRKRENEELIMISVRVYKSDIDFIKESFDDLGQNKLIRTILRRFVNSAKSRIEQPVGQELISSIEKDITNE